MNQRTGLQRVAIIAIALVAVFVVVLQLRGGDDGDGDKAGGSSPSGTSSASSAASSKAARTGASPITLVDLPTEARATITKIRQGGPFPYERDGLVFENREGLLPPQPAGYYHEYTVPTPGEGDRGARRIVQSADGVLFWSPDHYQTFRVIEDPTG